MTPGFLLKIGELDYCYFQFLNMNVLSCRVIIP